MFSTIKDKPQENDLINNHDPETKGLFDYAGRLGNTQKIIKGFPRHMFVKYNEASRGSWNQTGVSPSITGDSVGNDDFYYTNLKTKITNDGSNCDDVLQAKYPDGEYYFFVRAYSILGRTFDQKQKVILNNWTPQIKSFTTNATPDKPLKAGDTVEIKIEFTEQMNTDKTPIVQIWDAKASQWKSLSLSGTAWSNSSDGRIKDALLKASATLPEFGETGEGTTQEIKVKVTEAYGKGADNDVIKEEHSEKDASGNELKITSDLYTPAFNDGSVVPEETNADEPQQVYVGVKLEDNESGFTPGEHVSINVEGVGTVSGQVDANGTIQAKFQSPVKEGTYPITVEIPKDKAGNESKEKKKTLKKPLKVTKKPDSDKPTNPDESLDLFSPSLTGNKAPRFGSAKVAIFKSGYAVELSDMLATFGEAADYIPPENFSPALASTYPILVIPSAGLANHTNNAGLLEKLTEYVENGGNLIVLTQPTDECYKLLPDKVESLGYFQDKACYSSTAGIRKYTPALAGQLDDRIDGTADGVIISWPENAETWLYRLKNNFPALISYQCGKGRIIVSNYYSDYAHGHSQLHRDEKALMRDLLSWGRDFGEIPEVKPGEMRQVAVPVRFAAGGAEGSVAQVRLILRNPDRKLFSTQEIPMEIIAGETKNVSFDFSDTDQSLSKNSLGIWWLNYELLGADGKVIQAEREGQRVALSKGLEGTVQSDLSITVNPTITMALEGTKIPFKIIARNNGTSNYSLTYKVNAVLGSSSGKITKREEVGSGSWTIGNDEQFETTLEFDSFKAYTSSINNSWAKNWWEFEFFDETGKVIVKELRGVSVYKPAVKTRYELWDLTNPNAEVFKPGDEIRLNYQFENLVPVGFPIQWEITVKAVNQNQRIIYQKTGNGFIDPVIDENIDFTIPTDCSIDKYQVDFIISSNGKVIPTICNQDNFPTSADYNLSIGNFRTTVEGIKFDLSNKGATFADYVIISRFYGKKFVEDHFTGTISASTVETLFIPLDAELITFGSSLTCYLVNPATGAERGFSYCVGRKLNFKLNSVQQDKNGKNLIYNLTIENAGVPLSGVQLAIFNETLSISKKYTLPDIGQGQKIDYSVEIPIIDPISNAYPIKFAFCYADGVEVLAYQHYPHISLGNFAIDNNGITFKAINDGGLNSDFKFSYQVNNDSSVERGEMSGFLAASETKQLTIPLSQYNPFKQFHIIGKLIYPSSGQEQNIYETIEPYQVELGILKEQTIVDNQLYYDLSVKNIGPEISNLRLSMNLSYPALQQIFPLSTLATGATCNFKGELELPEGLVPGTYNVTYHLVSGNEAKMLLGSGNYTIVTPQLGVHVPAKTEFAPGDSYDVSIVNSRDFSTSVAYNIQVNDGTGKVLATHNGSVDLGPNQTYNLSFPIGTDWAATQYFINWELTTSPIRIIKTGYQAFVVKGAEIGLTVSTDRVVYNQDQNIHGQAQLTNGSYPVSGNLDLSITQIVREQGERIDQFPCSGGNLQRTGFVKLSGNIDKPEAQWINHNIWANLPFWRKLIGDVDGDERNEIINVSNVIQIIDGVSGLSRDLVECPRNSAPYSVLLYDLNYDGKLEIIGCWVDSSNNLTTVMAVNGKGEKLWVREFDQQELTSEFMTIADLNDDGSPELLLDRLVLNAETGVVIKTDGQLGTVGDLDRDGKLEIVTKEAVLDNEFNVLATRSGGASGADYPTLADLDSDGFLEIILYDSNNLYVYDRNYSLLWMAYIPSLTKVACGDVNHDGNREIIVSNYSNNDLTHKLYCYSSSGNLIWDYSGDYNQITDMLLNDINGDGHIEVICGTSWKLYIHDGRTGTKILEYIPVSGTTQSFNRISIGDVNGDFEAEIVGDRSCLGSDAVKRHKEPALIVNDLRKESNRYSLYRTFFRTDNGVLWVAGSNCVSYYDPVQNRAGIINIPSNYENYPIIYPTTQGIKVYGYNCYEETCFLIGYINQDTFQFTPSPEKVEIDFYPDIDTFENFFNGRRYYTERVDKQYELFVQDLATGEISSLGKPADLCQVLAAVDDNTLIVNTDSDGSICLLSLSNFTMTKLYQSIAVGGSFRLNSDTIILYGEELLKYNVTTKEIVKVVLGKELQTRAGQPFYDDYYWGDFIVVRKDNQSIYYLAF